MSSRIARNHTGHRVGEHHQRASLTDEQVRIIRSKYATGCYTYGSLAAIYRCGESTVRDIVKYWTRASA